MAISPPIAIPTEQIGSISGAVDLIERIATGESKNPNLALLCEDAVLDTFERAETTGSPVVTNDAQRSHHHSATYAMHGIPGTAPDGFKVPFLDDHARGVLRLTRGPLRYKRYVNCGFSPFRHDTSTSCLCQKAGACAGHETRGKSYRR
jgi:5-methyltetrahydropteroyltriglutamate--homocysteine methyltransferase